SGTLPAAERVIGYRYRNGDIHAHHADLDAIRELAGSIAAAREDRHAVAVLMIARKADRLLETRCANDLQHGTEDLFAIRLHLRRDAVEQCRPEEESVLISLEAKTASVAHELGTFVD